MIDKRTLAKYFPAVVRAPAPDLLVRVSGLLQRSQEVAVIKIRIKARDGRYIWISATAYVVKTLLCGLIVSNNTIHPYSGIIDIGASRLLIGKAQHVIPVSVKKELLPGKELLPTSAKPTDPLPLVNPKVIKSA
jgi:hypothetical protein